MNTEFQINETNKALYDKNFKKVEGSDDIQTRSEDEALTIAEPLNNDPEIQLYGAITEVLKYGYLNRDYRVYKVKTQPICHVSKEPLRLYDVVLLLNDWEEAGMFAVFMGTKDLKLEFKFLGGDEIRTYCCEYK